mgnify:CR=1 FL=1
MKKSILILTLVFLLMMLLLATLPVTAEPQVSQLYYYTPTADQDGRIVYIVKGGESCLSISLLTGVSLDELRRLNNLNDECTVYEGQELLLGIVEEATETPGPTPTATSILPTPTPFKGYAQVCVALYEDANGNAVREESEAYLDGGAVSISDALGKFSQTKNIAGEDNPACVVDVPEGKYTISVAIPEGYNPTTEMTYTLEVRAGDDTLVNFGAQPNAILPTETAANPRSRNPLLAIAGGLMLLGGAGLGLYFWLARRNSSPVP